jgi:transposase
VTKVLEKYQVVDLLRVSWQTREQVKQRHGKRGRPRAGQEKIEEVKVWYEITKVSRQQEQIKTAKERLGWRVQVTNVAKAKLSLSESVLVYRDGWCLERNFHLLKDKPLGISPLYLKTEEQIIGLTKLLTIGLRVMTWLEMRVRETLDEDKKELTGLYEGQPKKTAASPTCVRLLDAISRLELTLIHVKTSNLQGWHLPQLPPLLVDVLDLLGLPLSLYESLAD